VIYDWRSETNHPGGASVFDAETGEWIRFVFFVDTEANDLGRYLLDGQGKLVIDPRNRTQLLKAWEKRRVRIEWDHKRINTVDNTTAGDECRQLAPAAPDEIINGKRGFVVSLSLKCGTCGHVGHEAYLRWCSACREAICPKCVPAGEPGQDRSCWVKCKRCIAENRETFAEAAGRQMAEDLAGHEPVFRRVSGATGDVGRRAGRQGSEVGRQVTLPAPAGVFPLAAGGGRVG
jgi:hypothetical protein